MKNIRSKSMAALSIMLLLSSVSVRAMEIEPQEIAAIERAASAVQVQPETKGWMDSAKGAFNSATQNISKGTSSLGSFGKAQLAKLPARPSFAQVKEFASNQVAKLPTLAETKEMAKNHPVIAGVAAAGVVAATGYVAYKGVKAANKGVQAFNARRAIAQTIAQIEAEVKADMQSVRTSLNSIKAGQPVDARVLGQNALDFVKQLDVKNPLKPVLLTYCDKAINLCEALADNSATLMTKEYREFLDAVKALEKQGLTLKAQPTLMGKVAAKVATVKAKVANLIPNMETVKAQAAKLIPNNAKTALIEAGVVATVAGLAYAGKKGYLGQAKNFVSNIDYAGNFAKVNDNVFAPAYGFAKNHKTAVGVTAVAAALGTTGYVKRDAIKKAAQARKANANRQAQLEANINASK